jgi:hypothetical protein
LKHAYPLLYRHVSRNGGALFEVSNASLSDSD